MDQDQITPAAKRIAATIIARAQILAMGTPSIPKECPAMPEDLTPSERLNEAHQAVRDAERILRMRIEAYRAEAEAFANYQPLQLRSAKPSANRGAKKGGAA
ncbi:hypothetical protein [Aquabacterium sp.]|uniref:hypothetical protein n=1 Tax=Aquabacterium sp. TaxID=1872578 RepID=UPI00378503D4